MAATAHRHAAAFLRNAGLIAAVLAIIAGIFGMHVLTGTHAMHPTATAGAESAASTGHAGHAASPETFAGHPSYGEQDTAGIAVEQCSGSGHCTSMQDMTMGCTPSVKTASLAAPPPGTLVLEIGNNTATAGAGADHWSYRPGSPSPCELSISRT